MHIRCLINPLFMIRLSMVYDQNNVFAKIIRHEIPAEIILENDIALAFYDINPQAKVHALVIPKEGYIDFDDFMRNSVNIEEFFRFIKEITQVLNLNSYRIITNKGSGAGQIIFHFHVHIISDDISNA